MKRIVIRTMKKAMVLLSIIAASKMYAQSAASDNPKLELVINTTFNATYEEAASIKDPLSWDLKNRYFAGSKGDSLVSFLSDQLEYVFEAKFEEMAIDIDARRNQLDTTGASLAEKNRYFLDVVLFVDTEASLNMKMTLRDPKGKVVRTFERILKKELLNRYDWWAQMSSPNTEEMRIQQILHEMATYLATRILDKTLPWIVESSVRIRVAVNPISQLRENPSNLFLEKAVKTMVESELSRSKEIMVSQADDSTLNYVIEGAYFNVGDELLINIRCIKKASDRILASHEIKLDEMNIEQLRVKISDICHRLKRAMKSDFKQEATTLAIVASPPIKSYFADKTSEIDYQIAREINRAVTEQLRQWTASPTGVVLFQNLKILYDPQKVEEYLHRIADPSEILADLDVEYLILLNYENVGKQFRLTVNLHSYSLDRPAFSTLVYDTCAMKTAAEKAIQSTVQKLLNSFCQIGLMEISIPCDSLMSVKGEYLGNVWKNNIELKDLRIIKGFGLRLGATDHDNVGLFYGKYSSVYLEAYFSYIIPSWRFGLLDFGVEPSFGIDFVKTHSLLKGILAANGFVNFKTVYSDLQYSGFPIIISLGGGVGGQGIRYIYSPGDPGYSGETPFSNSKISPAYNVFGEIEFALTDRYRFHGFLRRVFRSDPITVFEDSNLSYNQKPVGTLGGYYFVLGIKYMWR